MKKTALYIVAAIILIGGVSLLIKLISGAIAVISGLLNAVISVVLILAMLAIVAWMFSYAKKHK